jgi:hypothetical protein
MKRIKLSLNSILAVLVFVAVGLGVYSNISEQFAVDRSKLPLKVELYKGFQRWITNLKNKGLDIKADEFRLKEENEIYNTKWVKVYSDDDEVVKADFEKKLVELKNVKKVVYSPSERVYIDFRNEPRDGYAANEARLYGQLDDKIIDARILDCSIRANCYFDRAYFLENDFLVISEISRNIDKKDTVTPECLPTQMCTYTFKTHVIDIKHNKRWIYESKPFDVVLADFMKEL